MTTFQLIALALTVLQAFDGWTTYKVLRMGGVEQNPLVQWFMERIGTYRALVVLKVGAAAIAWVLAAMPVSDDLKFALLAALAVLYVVIAAMNYNVYCKMKEKA